MDIIPIYDTCFSMDTGGVARNRETDLPVSARSFVAFKIPVTELGNMLAPTVTVALHVTHINMLCNQLGKIGLYEMSDSTWVGTDTYASVDARIASSPLAIPDPNEWRNYDCNDSMPGTFELVIPSETVMRWKERRLSVVSMAIAPYGEFEPGGYVTIGSTEQPNPDECIVVRIEEGSHTPVEPIDVVIVPSTLVPGSRVDIEPATPDKTFDVSASSLVAKVGGEVTRIVSVSATSLKIVVPDVDRMPEGAIVNGRVSLEIVDNYGDPVINPIEAYYDSDMSRRNKYFTDPSRPSGDIANASNSAMYNRDLGFVNFAEVTDENSLVQNIYNILLTRKGERLFNQEFGTTLEERVFALMGAGDEDSILQECYTAIREYEPRVSVDYDASRVEMDYDGNTIRIILALVLPQGSSEYIVLPFSMRGGAR